MARSDARLSFNNIHTILLTMAKTLYLDAIGGVAGDMLLAALVDAGAPLEAIQAGLPPVEGLRLDVERVKRCGVDATMLTVACPPQHAHRKLRDVLTLVDTGDMPPAARNRAHAAFTLLADAEGRVHGMRPDEVTFHEVGAVDAIADICGVAMALELLGVDEVVCSPLPLGRGTTIGAHGVMPLPAPATLELLRGVEVYGLAGHGETVTPTGAALVASLASSFGPMPPMNLGVIGTGAGRRDPSDVPNVVRALIGERTGKLREGQASVIETNLDDLLPELVPDAVEACFAAGALDVWTVPAGMKHGRPGFVLSAIARPRDEDSVARAMLHNTSALGVRISRADHRSELARTFVTVEVDGHPLRVKLGVLNDEVVNVAPEHRDCVAVASVTGRTVKSTWVAALAAAHRLTEITAKGTVHEHS
ncbi:nickel pincer cofactor biosynthesis protein LarC [Mycobacterium sp. URHB0044]|uniref:nickel pincer cofactor biosynthesis protein LarC n=1 Tax=Mycobacterium sp. URHB0044 TaxID=1380386 RepID=UPI0009DE07C7|nr:nickel pincer cofactor biosynthesis protein LarC [Mycobacterium sp. URHB0044]